MLSNSKRESGDNGKANVIIISIYYSYESYLHLFVKKRIATPIKL